MSSRSVDHLIAELTARYDLSAEFVKRLRPMVVTILSDEIAEERRIPLLEEVAATCQREQTTRRDLQELRVALTDLMYGLARLRDADPRG